MDGILEKTPWLAGGSYSLADFNTYSAAAGLEQLFPDLVNRSATPRVIDWVTRMNARPGVKAALAMPDKVPETLKALGA